MHRLDDWPGKREETQIEYEIFSEHSACVKTAHDEARSFNVLTDRSYTSTDELIKADKSDCLIAASIGVLTGLLDVFWVGELSISDAQTWGRAQINEFVIKIAQSQGYQKDGLEGAIRYLEKMFPNPSDRLTPDFGGGHQHHLRDFSHHPSPFGLVCSIITQFTEKGYGTDTDGNLLRPTLLDTTLIGDTFEEKIMFGVINWFFHLVSDMAGSNQSAGAGTGIPGPLLSLLKEASVLPFIKDMQIAYKGEPINFSKWISKLFNGTAFPHDDYKKLIRFDLRTEIGIGQQLTKQAVPVLINQCLVRCFYFFKRLILEIKKKDIHSITELNKLDPYNFMPFNNRCINRMLTISSGIFTAVDATDAVLVKSGWLSVNFIGIGNFIIVLKNDVKYITDDIKDIFQTKAEKLLDKQKTIVSVCSAEVEVIMDNTDLYRYSFDRLIKLIKDSRDSLSESYDVYKKMMIPIFDLDDYNFELYKAIESSYDYIVLNAVKELLVKLFVQNSIPYIQEKPFHFTMIKNGKKTGYNLTYDIEAASPKKQNLIQNCEENDVDCVNAIILGSIGKEDTTSLVETWNQWYEKNNIPVRQITLQNFFDYWFGIDEYEIFMGYVNSFNERTKSLISFNTVLMPTEETLEKFKFTVSTMLLEYPYRDLIPNDIFESQIDILHRNYFNRGLYKAMVGEDVFAESFISSEWLYNIDKVTGCIDKTGIVAGYLKSVEQLLFAVIQLSKDSGKTIRARDKTIIEYISDNEERIDSTLGSLAAFVDHNSSVLNVSNYVKHHMVETIDDWREKQRNGYFHKDNLRDFKKVDEIRQEAIYLYFLVLGGFSIDDAQFEQLGIYDEKHQTSGSIKIDLQYEDFDEWLSPMLRYDIPKDAVAVYFTLRLKHNNSCALQLTATSRFDEKDYSWLSETVFFSIPDLSDWQSSLTIEELQTRVIDYIKRYWDTGEYSKKLKEFAAVAFWHKDNVEIIYKK